MQEKLDTVRTTELKSSDGWSYIIEVYEDVTEIYQKEYDGNKDRIGQLTTGYDIQVCEEIIRMRKQKLQEEAV